QDLVVRRATRLEAIEQTDVQGAAERGRTADLQLTVACARSRATDRLIEGAAGRLREVAGDRDDAGRGGAADLAGVDQVALDVAGAGPAAAGRDVPRGGGERHGSAIQDRPGDVDLVVRVGAGIHRDGRRIRPVRAGEAEHVGAVAQHHRDGGDSGTGDRDGA